MNDKERTVLQKGIKREREKKGRRKGESEINQMNERIQVFHLFSNHQEDHLAHYSLFSPFLCIFSFFLSSFLSLSECLRNCLSQIIPPSTWSRVSLLHHPFTWRSSLSFSLQTLFFCNSTLTLTQWIRTGSNWGYKHGRGRVNNCPTSALSDFSLFVSFSCIFLSIQSLWM